jgi:DNA-binding response OmpR family regulator
MGLRPSIVTRRRPALPGAAPAGGAPPGPYAGTPPDPGGGGPAGFDSLLNGWTATISTMRVLVVEDEVDLADAVARGLRREGYAVDVAYDGDEALDKLSINEYDVICLDLNLPGTDGIEVTRRLRLERNGPSAPRVLMLTARDQPRDRVVGLDEGADDYLIKPFDFDELKARVRALLRRDAGRSGALMRVGDLELDTARHEARRAGRDLSLTPKEFSLLRYFMSRAGQVLSQEDLLEHVWDEHADPFTNTVRVTVMTLRRKLAEAGDGQPIETVVGRGYRLREGS